jgi:transcriptional regulator with XRE-family HTH domain
MENDKHDLFLKELGSTVRRIRNEKRLSMETVANDSEIDYRQLGRIERGEGNISVITEEIVKALGYPLLDASKMTFSDVDINSVRAKYIYTAFYNNIIFGQSDELFAPDLNITRQEAYTILVRAFEAKIGRSIQYFEESPINDYMNLSPWAMDNKCILKAAGVGFLVTNSYNNLIPQGHVSEKEFVLIVEKFREALYRY